MIAIETDRLYFRKIFESDDYSILELDSDPAIHQYLGNHPIKDIIQARDLIQFIRQQYVNNGIGLLAIIEKETDNFVGWGGFKLITNLVNGHKLPRFSQESREYLCQKPPESLSNQIAGTILR